MTYTDIIALHFSNSLFYTTLKSHGAHFPDPIYPDLSCNLIQLPCVTILELFYSHFNFGLIHLPLPRSNYFQHQNRTYSPHLITLYSDYIDSQNTLSNLSHIILSHCRPSSSIIYFVIIFHLSTTHLTALQNNYIIYIYISGDGEVWVQLLGVRGPAIVLFLFYVNVPRMRTQSRLSSLPLAITAS